MEWKIEIVLWINFCIKYSSYLEHVIKKQKTVTDNPPLVRYVNKTENSIAWMIVLVVLHLLVKNEAFRYFIHFKGLHLKLKASIISNLSQTSEKIGVLRSTETKKIRNRYY